MKVLAHNFRNSYEVIPDSYGNLWQNDNDDQVVSCRTAWLMEGVMRDISVRMEPAIGRRISDPGRICLPRTGTRKIRA